MYWNDIYVVMAIRMVSWIVTLDVLKFCFGSTCDISCIGWIVTLDVLK